MEHDDDGSPLNRPAIARVLGRILEPEGHFGAQSDGLAGFLEQPLGHVKVADDREAPVVQRDQLWDYLSAQLASIACDRVNPQPDAGSHG